MTACGTMECLSNPNESNTQNKTKKKTQKTQKPQKTQKKYFFMYTHFNNMRSFTRSQLRKNTNRNKKKLGATKEQKI